MKSYLLILTFFFNLYSLKADGIRWIRACLDGYNNRIILQFKVKSDCDSVYTEVYGERISGSGYKKIGYTNSNGFQNLDLDAENSKDWSLYLVFFNKCTGDSIISEKIKADNTPPQGIKIDSVSVIEGDVMIGWEKSTSTDLKYYVLYYDIKDGLGATLDTIKNGLFYIEKSDSLNAGVRSETYRLAAFDSCDISTGPIDAHSTIFLSLDKIDYCERNFKISRNNYYGWDLDKIEYSLVYKAEGATTWKKLSAFDFTDLFLNLDKMKQNFEIKVRALNLENGYTSSSNSIKITFSDERKLDSFYIYYVELNPNIGTKLKWFSNKTDLVQFFDLEYSENGITNWGYVKRIDAKNGGLFSIQIDNKISGRFYRLKAISDCWENIGYSNSVIVQGLSLVFPDLKFKELNRVLENTRVIKWVGFRYWKNVLSNYEVSRYMNGSWEIIGNTQDTFLIDYENLSSISVDSGICYKVKTIEQIPFSETLIGESRTNKACVFFDFHGDLPTGFVPLDNGEAVFTIPVDNLDRDNSYLKVFNRWGEVVFDKGYEWNGGFDNDITRPCPDGMYFYTGRIQLQNREFYFISNKVLLIRN